MSERWHSLIRSQEAVISDDSFWLSQPKEVPEMPEVSYSLLSVREGNNRGLAEGIYAMTNLTPEGYNSSFEIRAKVHSRICLDLADLEGARGFTDGPEMALSDAIKIELQFRAPNGGAVLRIDHVLPSRVDDALRNALSGEAKGVIIPITPETK